ncbi:acyl-CoA dehydrogenase [Marinomonas sp. S3726]|uniref:acyl-CoA dehydrogenase n=1 Tax=Marinomonas sp. S3726 TaxID=579484 RepID=UPI0005FA01FE|nr:acyl-CoA dehydrogenase [Marinomonas sp. S3726]
MDTKSNNSAKETNAFRVDLRDQMFLLWEQFRAQDTVLDSQIYPEFNLAFCQYLITHAKDFAYQEMGPLYQVSDRQGAKLSYEAGEQGEASNKEQIGKVILPPGFEQLWQSYKEAGWGRLGSPLEYDGLGAPYLISQSINEIFMGANPAFMIYSGFASPALYLIDKFGDDQLKSRFCEPLAKNDFAACLCMTEPDAGSDVGNIRTKAVKQDNGMYRIEGEKIFISAGMHDLNDNIAYIVLARVEGAKKGTVGLSCFVVPRYQLESEQTGSQLDSQLGSPIDNGVRCVRLEKKMGLHGCATAQISFGQAAPCYGYLLGERENVGLKQLMTMMNLARIATGIYALGMASSAYLNAAEYAGNRIQGTSFKEAFNPRAQRVAIIEHIDVKRMLLEMKSKVEGCRALILKLCMHQSQLMNLNIMQANPEQFEQNHTAADKEEIEAQAYRHQSLVNLLTPIVKAYTSDQAFHVAETAIQVYGGHGYISDNPVEQYARDIKVMSLWEGTNFVQSADLFRDKLAMGRHSKLLALYQEEIMGFLTTAKSDEATFSAFAPQAKRLEDALNCLVDTHKLMGSWIRQQKMERIFAVSTRFLEMMAEVTLGWLLLDSMMVAKRALVANDSPEPEEQAFYQGKIQSGLFFMNNTVPNVFAKAQVIALEDDSAEEASAEMFLSRGEV